MKTRLIISIFLSLAVANSRAQNILKLSIKEAENLFIKNNYQLILSKYDIDLAKADVITARLFENPVLNHDNSLYNHINKKFFEVSGQYGQFTTQLSQLIRLAGKRNKGIKLAELNTKSEEYQYYDLMRTLKFQLYTSFYKVNQLQNSSKLYQIQIDYLTRILKTAEIQLKQGNVAIKDVVNLKSTLYELNHDLVGILNEKEEVINELKLLIGVEAPTIVETLTDTFSSKINIPPYQALIDSAKNNRADLKVLNIGIKLAEQNIKIQKANAIPDINLSLTYDLNGSSPDKYTGIGLSLPLPLFNRNQGEIAKSKISLKTSTIQVQQLEQNINVELIKTWQKASLIQNQFKAIDKDFMADYSKLFDEMSKNLLKHNISMMEFLDFYERYKNNTMLFNQMEFEIENIKAEINYVTGTTIYKYE